MIFNLLGLGMAFAAAFIGAIATGLLFRVNGGPLLYGVGVAAILIDVIYRATKGGKQWVSPNSGGHIWFIPIWVLGIVAIVGAPFVPALPR